MYFESKKELLRLLIGVFFLIVSFENLFSAEWTFFVYMAGDNSLSGRPDQVKRDINWMEIASATSTVNIIVLCDKSSTGDTKIYKISNDTDTENINSQEISLSSAFPSAIDNELNMGDAQNLVCFSTWTFTRYPAKKYILVLWNHGGGWHPRIRKSGISWDNNPLDEMGNPDFLTLEELNNALSLIKNHLGRKLDILVMDACLMAQIEVMYEIKDCVEYVVASEEKSVGLPYHGILPELISLSTYTAVEDFSEKIVEMWNKAYSDETVNYFITYKTGVCSSVKLSYTDELVSYIDNLGWALTKFSDVETISKARDETEYFGFSDNSTYGGIDLYNFCENIIKNCYLPQVRDLCNNIMSAISFCSFAKCSGEHTNSKGIAINFPLSESQTNEALGNYAEINFSKNTYWNEFLHNYYSGKLAGIQSLSYVSSGPNPYNPKEGSFVIRNLPKNLSYIKLKIYTFRGEIVRELYASSEVLKDGEISWDGKNEQNKTVASGIYFFRAETERGHHKGKLTLIKK